MSEEITTKPEPFTVTKDTPISEVNKRTFPEIRILKATFEVPTILLARDEDVGTVTLRPGGLSQVEFEIEEWFSFEKVEDFPLGVQRLSPLKFEGRNMAVLDGGSIPTAADYMASVGKRVLWQFSSVEIPLRPGQLPDIYEKSVFKNRRVYVVLP